MGVIVLAVQNTNVVKITDFGLAKLLDSKEDVFKAAGGKVSYLVLFLQIIFIIVCLLTGCQSISMYW